MGLRYTWYVYNHILQPFFPFSLPFFHFIVARETSESSIPPPPPLSLNLQKVIFFLLKLNLNFKTQAPFCSSASSISHHLRRWSRGWPSGQAQSQLVWCTWIGRLFNYLYNLQSLRCSHPSVSYLAGHQKRFPFIRTRNPIHFSLEMASPLPFGWVIRLGKALSRAEL